MQNLGVDYLFHEIELPLAGVLADMESEGVAIDVPYLKQMQEELGGQLAAIESDDTVRLPGSGPLAVGAPGFSDDGEGELIVPAVVVGLTRMGQAWRTETGPSASAPPPGRPSARPLPSRFVVDGHGLRPRWGEMIDEALARIGSGALSKVVLAREVTVEADRPFDVPTILTRLRGGHPTCFTFVRTIERKRSLRRATRVNAARSHALE